jgi:hypothetical protein
MFVSTFLSHHFSNDCIKYRERDRKGKRDGDEQDKEREREKEKLSSQIFKFDKYQIKFFIW